MRDGETIKTEQDRLRSERVKQTGEVFTPDNLVNEMLDKLPQEAWREDKTFIDPACGNGQFLVHILWRKLSKGHDTMQALATIFGVDIESGNIRHCRLRLLKIISVFEDVSKEHIKIVFNNIVYPSITLCPNGSLDYLGSNYPYKPFRKNTNRKDIDRWYDKISRGELEFIDLPIENCDPDNPYDDNPDDIFGDDGILKY